MKNSCIKLASRSRKTDDELLVVLDVCTSNKCQSGILGLGQPPQGEARCLSCQHSLGSATCAVERNEVAFRLRLVCLTRMPMIGIQRGMGSFAEPDGCMKIVTLLARRPPRSS